jgi:hypothetical protein
MLNAKGGWLARLPALLFAGVFALAFGLTGVLVGIKPIVETAISAWTVRSWQPVPAEVLHTELKESRGSKGSVTYSVQARYRYVVGDELFESSRIGLDESPGSDNIGDWHERWHARLQASQNQGLRLLAFVDPQQPQRAVLEPSIRWPLLLFQMPFALVFTGVGVGASWAFWRICRGEREPLDKLHRDPKRSDARGLWVFAFFWCGLSFPMTALVWVGDAPWGAKAMLSVFALVGVGLIWAALRAGRR